MKRVISLVDGSIIVEKKVEMICPYEYTTFWLEKDRMRFSASLERGVIDPTKGLGELFLSH